MPIYGDQLAFFSELMEDYEIFKMPALTGGGYGKRYARRPVVGYLSYIKGGTMGIEGESRTENQNITMWIQDDSGGKGIVQEGDYVEKDGDVFVFNHDDGFSIEGGFLVYNLQLVPAFTGQQQRDKRVDLGQSDFN